MKASEVIARLQELVAEHGDCEVCATFMDMELHAITQLYDADGGDGETKFYFSW